MLNINDYDYPLPEERIAKYPLKERDHSKLLVYKEGVVGEDYFYHLGHYIPEQSLLVYNNTKVIPARLVFHKSSGARIEIFCLEPISPHDYESALSTRSKCCWKCMVGNLKKWKTEALHITINDSEKTIILHAEKTRTQGNTHTIQFTWSDDSYTFAEILERAGELPIPPYLNRPTEESDKQTYQTIYSRIKGSVAAPTAGLHFTQKVLNELRANGIKTCELTLHVGAGTFQPVKTEDAEQHTMHTEIIAVPRDTIQELINNLGHIVAVGTTSMRTLESLYYIGCQLQKTLERQETSEIHINQFEPYEHTYTLTTKESLETIITWLTKTNQDTLHAETQIMIKPGYKFRIVNQLITNFHQPKSTLLLLVSAFVGEDWHKIYNYALEHDFRFLSYGDSSILFKHEDK